MKKSALLLFVSIFFCISFAKAQTNILVYSENFEGSAPGVQLNIAGVGSNTGTNLWTINNAYSGAPTYPNTPDQNTTSGGNISFAPFSKYLHIHDQPSGILSACFNPTAASDRFVQLTNGFCTLGMYDVKLTFFYIAHGLANGSAEIVYSVDNGPWTPTGTAYNDQLTWQYTILQNTAWNNVNSVRFGIRWQNPAGAGAGDVSFGIDDIFVTGFFDNFVTQFNVVIDSVSPNPICQNFGLLIKYHLTNPICGNGFFEVQLSNSAGAFTAPVSLGIYMASNSFMNSTLWPTIPANTAAGTCYKVRIHYYYTDYGLSLYSNASNCIEVLQCPNTITTNQPVVTMGTDSLCVGSVIDIPFFSTGVFQNNNNYIAQLSDSTGAFSSNLNILGSKVDKKTYDPALGSPPGSVSGMVLATNQPIPEGCNYYVRVISTNPAAIGMQWGPFCIKHCDIETNNLQDIKACINSTTGFTDTIFVNVHYTDSSATAAIYDPANEFKLEIHNSQNFNVIPPVGGVGTVSAVNDTTMVITIPNATQLATLGLQPGLYYVRIIATNSNHPWDINGTLVRLTIGAPADNIWVLQSPADSVLCVGDAVFFYPIPYNAGPPMNSTYQWYLNGVIFSTEPAIGILFNGAGTYNITVRETNFGCPGPLTPNSVSLDVLAPPSAAIIGPLQVCLGDTLYYHSVFHTNYYYEWTTTGGAMIDTSNNELYIRFDTAGIYTIHLLALNKCGQTIKTVDVIVSEHPDASFTAAAASVCTGDSLNLTYTGITPAPLIYSWNLGGGTAVPGGNNPVQQVVWNSPGTYKVVLDVSKYSCHTKDSTMITVVQKPSPAFTASGYCLGMPTLFTDSSSGPPLIWEWHFGDTAAVSNLQSPSHTYGSPGNYYVTLMVINGMCADSLSDSIHIAARPTSDFRVDEQICLGKDAEIVFTGTASPTATYNWNFSGATVSSGTGPGPYIISVQDSGAYLITLMVTQDSCPSDTTAKSVFAKVCEVTIPNIITPNGDGKNDVLRIAGLESFPESALFIYNRWGKLIYQNNDYQNDWDGENHADGVYYYVLILKDKTSYGGTVTIMH